MRPRPLLTAVTLAGALVLSACDALPDPTGAPTTTTAEAVTAGADPVADDSATTTGPVTTDGTAATATAGADSTSATGGVAPGAPTGAAPTAPGDAAAVTTAGEAAATTAAATPGCGQVGEGDHLGGDLVVGAGRTCHLDRVFVEGDLRVERGATLVATDLTVLGDLVGRAPASLAVDLSAVAGDVEVVDAAELALTSTVVRGDVSVQAVQTGAVLHRNTVEGHLRVGQGVGPQELVGNTVGGHLDCSGNDPWPTGWDNDVEGDALGQCEALAG